MANESKTFMLYLLLGEDFAGAWSEVENCRLSCQNDEYTAVVLKRI